MTRKAASAQFGWTAALTVLLGAFLLFQVQPLISKSILPWFGGSPAVWTTCMLFFQVALLAGYAIAHLVVRYATRKQAITLLVMLVIAIVTLPIAPGNHWKPTDGNLPALKILLVLTASVGLPYLVLATTGPLVQAWFAARYEGQSPYRLYALSNVGSLAALLTYPFIFEPLWGTTAQSYFWSIGFVAFALLYGGLAWSMYRAAASAPDESDSGAVEEGEARGQGEAVGEGIAEPPASARPSEDAVAARQVPGDDSIADAKSTSIAPPSTEETPPTRWNRFMWLALPATGVVLLLAITNHVCQDIAVIPFLWVAPLSIYLLTFIITFDRPAWYRRGWFGALAAFTLLFAASLHAEDLMEDVLGWFQKNSLAPEKWDFETISDDIRAQVVIHLAALFAACMVCHGELFAIRPNPKQLTIYYLSISAGGALGGLFVSLASPLIFPSYVELSIGFAIGFALASFALLRAVREMGSVGVIAQIPLMIVLLGLYAFLMKTQVEALDPDALFAARNFYGLLRVREYDKDEPAWERRLVHGRILHGLQLLHPSKRHIPTTYYTIDSGAGLAVDHMRGEGPLRVAVVGLGAGTMAAYGENGDNFHFYDINPLVVEIAKKYFTFLDDSGADIDIRLGDARLTLERLESQSYDVMVIDAFSGDSIPIHLITTEAISLYRRHLKENGVLAIHVSNLYLRLTPVVRRLAKEHGMEAVVIVSSNSEEHASTSEWVLLTNNQTFLNDPFIQAAVEEEGEPEEVSLWSDQYSNLLEVFDP